MKNTKAKVVRSTSRGVKLGKKTTRRPLKKR